MSYPIHEATFICMQLTNATQKHKIEAIRYPGNGF